MLRKILGTLLACQTALCVDKVWNKHEPVTTFGPDGRVTTRALRDSQGTITTYGPTGQVLTRESNGTIYDARTGKVIAKDQRR